MMDNEVKIGDPIMFVDLADRELRIYGRVAGFEGTEYGNVFPIIRLCTPGGSVLTAGRVWFQRISSDEDLQKLEGFEIESMKRRGCPREALYDAQPSETSP